MRTKNKRTSPYKSNVATLGFEEKLWAAADNLLTMAGLRDALLPRLMSGEVRVDNAS